MSGRLHCDRGSLCQDHQREHTGARRIQCHYCVSLSLSARGNRSDRQVHWFKTSRRVHTINFLSKVDVESGSLKKIFMCARRTVEIFRFRSNFSRYRACRSTSRKKLLLKERCDWSVNLCLQGYTRRENMLYGLWTTYRYYLIMFACCEQYRVWADAVFLPVM